jgi:DNA-binding NarL/FixJ family response regulator
LKSQWHQTQNSLGKKLYQKLEQVASFELIGLVEKEKKKQALLGRSILNKRCFQVSRDILRGESQIDVAEKHGIALGTVRADVKLVIMWIEFYRKGVLR